jgi:hypothetical protein
MAFPRGGRLGHPHRSRPHLRRRRPTRQKPAAVDQGHRPDPAERLLSVRAAFLDSNVSSSPIGGVADSGERALPKDDRGEPGRLRSPFHLCQTAILESWRESERPLPQRDRSVDSCQHVARARSGSRRLNLPRCQPVETEARQHLCRGRRFQRPAGVVAERQTLESSQPARSGSGGGGRDARASSPAQQLTAAFT